MPEETSLWPRIRCYLVSTEASGYDGSPCVAAIVETGTLPCVDDVYEPPTVNHVDCEANGIKDLLDSSSGEECNWPGEYRSTDELYGWHSGAVYRTCTLDCSSYHIPARHRQHRFFRLDKGQRGCIVRYWEHVPG